MLLFPEHPAIEFGFIDCNSLLGAMFPEYQDVRFSHQQTRVRSGGVILIIVRTVPDA